MSEIKTDMFAQRRKPMESENRVSYTELEPLDSEVLYEDMEMPESGEGSLAGLSEAEVKRRVAAGEVNISASSSDRTYGKIIRDNVLTYFNLIFLVITVLLCIAGAFKDLTFLPIIVGNMLIGIIQESRAKHIVDKMKIMNAAHAVVIREGKRKKVTAEELVLGDTIWLSAGDSICADAKVISGEIIVNESMLTGEADGITKESGAELFSGSFVVSGEGYATLTKVGNDSYISKLTNEAKTMKKGEQSEMVRSINGFVKVIGFVIIPLGVVLFLQSFLLNQNGFQESIRSMVASVLGLIPEGLYLLTTIALALSMIRLARNKVLLHDMKSIEMLARVDVLCVDKTGTITKPDMVVHEIVCVTNEMEQALTNYTMASIDNNATANALKSYVKDNQFTKNLDAERVYPFNSTNKYGVITMGGKHYVLGAPEFILHNTNQALMDEIHDYASKGYRVIVLATAQNVIEDGTVSGRIDVLGMVVLANEIRDNAVETFTYFKEQGVMVKVISGDNPVTVSEVAKQAGIENAEKYIDASTLTSTEMIEEAMKEYTVFGRVTPSQKKEFVQALKKQGHTVAMTGDGVNDILALRDADCSIAMASGSEATAQASQIVLLDSDFSRMPKIVLEGRQVVNNVQRSACLFLVKNIFSLLLTIFVSILAIPYPIRASQLSLISYFTIGIPGFLLALEPNKQRITGRFLPNVLKKAIPGGIADFFVVCALVVCGRVFGIAETDIATASTLLIAAIGFIIVIRISYPFNGFRWANFLINLVGLAFCGIFMKSLFDMHGMSEICILLTVVFSFAGESALRYMLWFVDFAGAKFAEFKKKHL